MMNIHFLGTGEAADDSRRNTSVLVVHDGRHHLLDCGFTSAQAYLQKGSCELLKTIWISHFHGDHFFGIPQLILHFHLQRRQAPLIFLAGTTNLRNTIETVLEHAYPGLRSKLSFQINYRLVQPDSTRQPDGLRWQCAPAHHSQEAYGLRISTESQALYFSGDGRPTAQCLSLMRGCDLIIHEAFSQQREDSYHFSVEECLDIAEDIGIKRLAMVHLNRLTREAIAAQKISIPLMGRTHIFIPDDGDEVQL